MKKLSLIPLLLSLMAGGAQAAEKSAVVSIEAKGFSASLTTLIGHPATITSGDLQKAPNQALCLITSGGDDKTTSTISDTLNYLSSTTVTVLPLSSDEKTVTVWLSFSRSEQKDPEVAVVDKDCSLATGLITTSASRQMIKFDWGVERKIQMLDGRTIAVTLNNPEPAAK